MRDRLKTAFVGKEKKVSKNGKAYEVVTFMDGTTPVNGLLVEGVQSPPLYTELEVDVNIRLGRYTKVEVESWKEVQK